MRGGEPCSCEGTQKEKRKNWRVIHRNHNHSYFEKPKGQQHYSDYSAIICIKCRGFFRTKSSYVCELKDFEEGEKEK